MDAVNVLFPFMEPPTGVKVYITLVMIAFVFGFFQAQTKPDFFNLEKNLGFYKAYHSNKINIIIHLLCIWPILWSYMVFASNCI